MYFEQTAWREAIRFKFYKLTVKKSEHHCDRQTLMLTTGSLRGNTGRGGQIAHLMRTFTDTDRSLK